MFVAIMSSLIGFACGFFACRKMNEAYITALEEINLRLSWELTEAQEEIEQLKGRPCRCAEKLAEMKGR